MSRQEQNDRHIIWSDISLDLDDWRESLEELYPGYSDDELYDITTSLPFVREYSQVERVRSLSPYSAVMPVS